MISRKEEEDQKSAVPSAEEETVIPSLTAYEHVQYLLGSLNAADLAEFEEILASVVDLLSLPAVTSYRKQLAQLSSALATALMKMKVERPFHAFAQMLERIGATIHRPIVAYRLARFAINVGSSLRLIQQLKQEDAKEELKLTKEAAIEARKQRKALKQEEASLFFVVMEKLLLKIENLNGRTLEKLGVGLATIGRKAEFKAEAKELQGNSKESLMKIFLYGLAAKSDPKLHLEIVQGLSAAIGSEGELNRVKDMIEFYRPVLNTCTESEIELTLAPQMVLLIKRSMGSFEKIAPIIKAFGKITTKAVSILIQTTLEDLISQEGSAAKYQDLLYEIIGDLIKKISNPENDSDMENIIENLKFSWKQQLGASEVESRKQLNVVKILANFLNSSEKVPEKHRKTLLAMMIELYGSIKQSEIASEAAIFLGKVLSKLSESLYTDLYECYSKFIFGKALETAKGKDLTSSLLYPLITHGLSLVIAKSPLIAHFLPFLTRTAWNSTISQLNFNAITQFSYNIAIVSVGFLLDARDFFESKEEKPSPNLKFLFFTAFVNRQDFIAQKLVLNFEALLHLSSVVLSTLVYPSFIEQTLNVIPTIANLFIQYTFSPKKPVRDQAIKMTRVIHERFANTEVGWEFVKNYQMAMYALVRHTNEGGKGYSSYAKSALGVMVDMLKELHDNEKIKLYFIRLFILMHNGRIAGVGKNKMNIAETMWKVVTKRIKNANSLLKKTAIPILTYLTSGKSLMSDTEGALVSEDQIQTILNITVTVAKEGMGNAILQVLKKIMKKDKLQKAESLYSEIQEKIETISRFDLEFLAEQINDLKLLSDPNFSEAKEEKKSKTGKKPAKKGKKPVKEENLSKEERVKEDRQVLETYINDIVDCSRIETKNSLRILKALCEKWHSLDLVNGVISLGLLNELRGTIMQTSVRFEAYITLNKLFSCLLKNSKMLTEAYFGSVINLTSSKYVKICNTMFSSLMNIKIESFTLSFIDIILDIAEFLIESTDLTLSIKSKVVEVVVRIILETNCGMSTIHRIAPITVKLLQSSYQAENLTRYLQIFWKRVFYNDMQDVVKNMWTYDLTQQLYLLHAIYSIKRPLPHSPWMSNVLLQCLFSDNKEMNGLAKNIMNERTICLFNVLRDQGKPSGIITMLGYKSKDLRDSAVKGVSGYLDIKPKEMPAAVQLFIEEFDNLVPVCRRTISDLFINTAHILPESELKAVFKFLLLKGVAYENDESKEFMESGIKIIQAQGKAHAGIIISAIEELLSNSKLLTNNASTIAVIFIGNVARYLAKEDPKLPALHATLQKMLSIRSENVLIAVAKCLAYFASLFKEDSKAKLTSILNEFRGLNSKNIPQEHEMMSRAFALAGCVKGLGVKSIDEFEIMKILEEPFKEKSSDSALSVIRKQCSLYMYAALSHTLEKTFEYYAVSCMPYILQSFAIGKENVRQTAQRASKAIISKLSGQGVKSILPSLLKEIDTTNWRSKLASVECLGSMAFMAPKQLSNYLPQIVSNIKIVLNDSQVKVHEAGISALTAIGSVIKNPEIADISGMIIQALKNPTKELIYAIDILLQQSFAHAIDAPSLSLIIPILDYGLRAQNNEVKIKATQLVRTICKVISDPHDMLPYLPVVIPALKSALFDPIPEVRSASAKALGSLCKGLGLENMREEIVWLKTIMQKESSLVEKSGAAQGYAEIIGEQGTDYLEGIIEQLMEKLRDKSSAVREGYFGLFLFLPLSFGESFEKYFTLILPVVLEALADLEESVRNTANRVVQICIRQYGQKRTDVLLEPLFQRMLDSNWRIRESALGLMADLLSVLEKDMTKEEPIYVSTEERSRILSILYILKFDNIDSIRITAAQIWKGIVDNQPKTLKVILPILINEILELVSKRGPELREVGVYTLHDFAERYSERFLYDMLQIFKERIDIEAEDMGDKTGQQYVQGIATCIYEILGVIDYKIVTENKNNIFVLLEPFIMSDDNELRLTIANAFASIIHKDLDNNFQRRLAKNLTSKLLEFEKAEETEKHIYIQDLIRLITKQRAKFGDDIVYIFSEEPLTPVKISTFTAMAQYLSTIIFTQHKAKKLLDQLFRTVLLDGKVHDATIQFFHKCTGLFESEDERDKWAGLWIDFMEQKDQKPQRARAFLKIYTNMLREVKEPVYQQYDKDMFERVVALFSMEDGEVPELLTEAIDATAKIEGKEGMHLFISRMRQEVSEIVKNKKEYLLPAFNKPKALEILMPIFQNTLMHGSVELRVSAAAMYCYVIQLTNQSFLKEHAAKIAGSLIRVVNDKFSLALKNKLLECTYWIMVKSGAAIRAFVSPLQTTLMKVINDPELSSPLKSIILRNMVELLKLMPKFDSLKAELLTSLKSTNTVVHATALGVLSLIGKIHGAAMTPEVRSGLFAQVSGYLIKLAPPVDENNLMAAAFAMMSLCHTSQEVYMLFDLAANKYQSRPEVSNCLFFALLLSPFGASEPGSKLVNSLIGKVKFMDNLALGRALAYVKFFITGIHGAALEEVLKLIEVWIPSLEPLGWESASALIEQIPFEELESMKIEGDILHKIRGQIVRYAAKESEDFPKDGMKELLRLVLASDTNIKDQIKKYEETKLITRDEAAVILSLIK